MVYQDEVTPFLPDQLARDMFEESRRKNRRVRREQVIRPTGELSSQSFKPVENEVPSVVGLNFCYRCVTLSRRRLFDRDKDDPIASVADFSDSVAVLPEFCFPVFSQ